MRRASYGQEALRNRKGESMTKATRVPVPLTIEERAEIEAGMKRAGIRAMADYLRIGALEKARKGGDA